MEPKCIHVLDGIVEWTGCLTGYQHCSICSKQVPFVVPEVRCKRKAKHCGYRLPDGVCVPISRYDYLFECSKK